MSATSLAPAMERTVSEPEPASARPSRARNFDPLKPPTDKPQSYHDGIKRRFAEERDLRLGYRPEGRSQYTSDLAGALATHEVDPFAEKIIERDPIIDSVDVLCIGGGFSALLTAARLREKGVESIRIVENGADVHAFLRLHPAARRDGQRTPSAIDLRDDVPTDPEWAASLTPGWQRDRRMKHMRGPQRTDEELVELAKLPREEKILRQEKSQYRTHDAYPSAGR